MSSIKQQIILETVDNTTKGMRSAQNKLNAFDRTIKRLQTTIMGFVGLNIGLNLVQGLIASSDQAIELDAKLKLVTNTTEEYNLAKRELLKLSIESGSALSANITLFTRINKSIISMGGSTQTTIDLTRTLSQALRISGASTAESNSVILQFSQSMASGQLRGEEFNSIAENGARVMQALSASLGVTIGDLRAMAKQGVLTSSVVVEALLEQGKVINEENAKLPLTIGRAFENIKSKWLNLLSAFGAGNAKLSGYLQLITDNFEAVTDAVLLLTKALTVYLGLKFASILSTKLTAIKSIGLAYQKVAIDQKAQSASEQTAIAKSNLSVKTQMAAISEKSRLANNAFIKQFVNEEKALNQAIRNADKKIALTQAQIVKDRALIAASSAASNLTNAQIKKTERAQARLSKSTSKLTKQYQLLNDAVINKTLSSGRSTKAIFTEIEARQAHINIMRVEQATITGSIPKNFRHARSVDGITASLKRMTIATTGAIAKMASGFGKVFSALLGWPLIIGTIALEIVSQFVPLDLVMAQLAKQWGTLTANATYYYEVIKNLGSSDEIEAKLTASIQAVDDAYLAAMDSYFENEAKKTELDNANADGSVKTKLNVIEQKKALDKEYFDSYTLEIDRASALEKAMASASITDKAALTAKLALIDEQAIEVKNQKLIQQQTEQGIITAEYYQDTVNKLQKKYDDESAIIEEQFIHRQFLVKGVNDVEIAEMDKLVKKHETTNKLILETEKQRATALIAQAKTTYDAIITEVDRLVAVERTANARRKSIATDYENFVNKTTGTQISSVEKLARLRDQQAEIKKTLLEAEKAQQAGNFKESARLSEKAYQASKKVTTGYKDIADSAKKGSLSQVQANLSVKTSLEDVKESADAVDTANKHISESAKSTYDPLILQAKEYQGLISSLSTKLDELAKPITTKVKVDPTEAYNDISFINDRIDALNKTVTVTVVEKRVQANQQGGLIYRADGGFIPRSELVPGSGSGDKVKAMLEPGEFIVKKSAVQKYGLGQMHAINDGVQKFKDGGIVNNSNGGLIKIDNSQNQARLSIENVDGTIAITLDDGIYKDVEKLNTNIDDINSNIELIGDDAQFKEVMDGINTKIENLPPLDLAVDKESATQDIAIIDKAIKELSQSVTVQVNSTSNSSYSSGGGSTYNSSGSSVYSSGGGLSDRKETPSDRRRAAKKQRRAAEKEKYSRDAADGNQDYQQYVQYTTDLKAGHGLRYKIPFYAKIMGYREWLDKRTAGDTSLWGDGTSRFAGGGKVPGFGLSDTVRALLRPEEYVLKAESAKNIGTNVLDKINNTGILPKSDINNNGESNNSDTISINLNLNGESAKGQFNNSDATIRLIEQLKASKVTV